MEMRQRWDTRDSLLQTFHVDRQMELTKDPERCFFQNAPTLWNVNIGYGFGTAQEWLAYQIADLSEFSGARDKITDRQLDQIIQLITDDYGFLNMAEIMLFCRRFKKGSYDKFYGSVDPIAIMKGLNEFVRERNEAYAKRERTQQERKEWQDAHNPNIMSREEWDIIKQVQAEYEMNTIEEDRRTEQKYKQIKQQENGKHQEFRTADTKRRAAGSLHHPAKGGQDERLECHQHRD